MRRPRPPPPPPPPRPVAATRAAAVARGRLVLTRWPSPFAARPVAAADGLTMEAHALLDGHARVGLVDGDRGPPRERRTGRSSASCASPAARRAGRGSGLPSTCRPSRTRPTSCTPSRRPSGATSTSTLVDGRPRRSPRRRPRSPSTTRPSWSSASSPSGPGDIVGGLDLLPNQNNVAPAHRRPRRRRPARAGRGVERARPAGLAGHRLVARSTPDQLAALRGWIAGGGRLVIVGGTAGPSQPVGLPGRPPALPPDRHDRRRPGLARRRCSGESRRTPTDLPALSGDARSAAGRWRRVGDRVVAAERAVRQRRGDASSASIRRPTGSPTRTSAEGLWRRLLPAARRGGPIVGDDSQIVQAASQLPSLALPPIGGLIALLGAYILLIGPINYLVLRAPRPARVGVGHDAGPHRRLRGRRLRLRRAPARQRPDRQRGRHRARRARRDRGHGARSTSASSRRRAAPTRSSVPGGALLSSPVSGDFFGGDGTPSALDVLQGDPARDPRPRRRVRLAADRPRRDGRAVPLIEADLRLEDGRLKGTVTNASNETLLQAGRRPRRDGRQARRPRRRAQTATVDVAIAAVPDRASSCPTGSSGRCSSATRASSATTRPALYARHTIIDQLTYDPNFGFTGQLPADGPVVLGLGRPRPAAGRDRGPGRRAGPATSCTSCRPTSRSSGTTTFRSDLLRSTVVAPTPRSSARTRTASTSGGAAPRCPTGRSPSTARIDADRAGHRPELRRARASRHRAQADRAAADDPGAVQRAAATRRLRPRSTACPRSSCTTSTARDVDATAAPRRRGALRGRGPGALRRPGHRDGPASASSTTAATASASASTSRSRETSMTAIVRTEGLVKRYDGTLAVAGVDLSRRAPARSSAWSARTAPARRRPCASWRRSSLPSAGTAEIAGMSVTRNPDQVRRVIGFMPDAFGVYDDMKVWEYLDFFARCYGIAPAGTTADDRRPARARRPRRQARRLRPDPVAGHAAAPVPRPRPRPRPAGAAPRRAGVRPGPARPGRAARAAPRAARRWARRSSSAATSSPSSRSCARASRSSTAARCSPRAASPTSSGGCASGPCCGCGCCSRARRSRPPAPGSPPIRTSRRAVLLDDGTIELGFRGDDAATARLLRRVGRGRAADRQLRPRRERPRGAVPAGDRARPRAAGSGLRRPSMTDLSSSRPRALEPPIAPPPGRSPARAVALLRPDGRRHRRDRRQGAARPDARPPRVHHPDHLPAAARRLRADGRDAHRAQLSRPASAVRRRSPARPSARASSRRCSC